MREIDVVVHKQKLCTDDDEEEETSMSKNSKKKSFAYDCGWIELKFKYMAGIEFWLIRSELEMTLWAFQLFWQKFEFSAVTAAILISFYSFQISSFLCWKKKQF